MTESKFFHEGEVNALRLTKQLTKLSGIDKAWIGFFIKILLFY